MSEIPQPSPLRRAAKAVVPAAGRAWLREQRHRFAFQPPLGLVRFGDLRRLTPISRVCGFDRGQPIDRYYMEQFLTEHAGDIRGRVLEIGDNSYTKQFGASRVTQSDVLHVRPGHDGATIVADLTSAPEISSDTFDCIILTHTLPFLYDIHAAVRTLQRMLKPAGVLLVTLPGISQISRFDMDRWGDFWRFTTLSARMMFEAVFPPTGVAVTSHGNVLVAIAFLHGLSAHELRPSELEHRDPDYQCVITVRAVKAKGAS